MCGYRLQLILFLQVVILPLQLPRIVIYKVVFQHTSLAEEERFNLHQIILMLGRYVQRQRLCQHQEGRGIGLVNKLLSYNLQDAGLDTVEANIKLGFKGDERDYGVGAQILRAQGISKMRLMSNNPTKRAGLIGYGLEVVENIPIEILSNTHNENYLKTKRDKMGHTIMKG